MTDRTTEIRDAIRQALRWSTVAVPPGEQGEAEGLEAAQRSSVAIQVDPEDSDRVVITQGGEHVESCTRAELREAVA